jgi:hypothetical protein
LSDALQDTFRVFQHFVVPKSQYLETGDLDSCRSRVVPELRVRVLTPIELDNYATLETDEVENEITVGVLAAEFASFNLTPAQALPKQMLGVGRRVAQSTLQLRIENTLVCLTLHVTLESNPSPPNPPLEGEGFGAARPVDQLLVRVQPPFTSKPIPTQPSP